MPYIQVKDLELFYEQMGTGEPILFLHSAYSRGILAFSCQLLDFSNQYTCFLPDFRGHGRTRCNRLEWSTPQLADDIIGFMDQLDMPRAHLVGYSLGAGVALQCAVKSPARIATLTTIGHSGFVDPAGADEFEPETLVQNGCHEMIQQMIERHAEAHKGDWQTFMRQSARDWRLYPQLTEDQIQRICCPSLFIAGENDQFAPEARLQHLSSLVNGSSYLVVPGCSHRPHMLRENPTYVNDAILEFLRSHPLR
ncbi:alpha/beta fold hydrolase [Alicyclobacillus fodiniaquatilis]|uniref:Alpha/beta fold hydrolase n=1 Tax=Alicyclobacillus fodiniaquatilis TaxID=1661150 RepID=A0ABW4JRS6_9BACL